MKLLSLLARQSKQDRIKVLFAASVGGVLTAGAVQVVNLAGSVPHGSVSSLLFGAVLIMMIIGMYVANRYSAVASVGIFEKTLRELRQELVMGLLRADVQAVERMEVLRGRAAGDLVFLSTTLETWVFTLQNLAFLVCTSLVILLVSPRGFLAWLAAYVLIGLLTWPEIGLRSKEFARVSVFSAEAHGLAEQLFSGLKQVKLDLELGESLEEDYRAAADELFQETYKSLIMGRKVFIRSISAFFLFGMAATVFGAQYTLGLEQEIVYDLVILFSLGVGPTLGALEGLNTLLKAEAAASSLLGVIDDLQQHAALADAEDGPIADGGYFDRLVLRNVRFTYDIHDDSSFEFGPIDLTIQRGELMFITGSNGSGKSTLVKLILGLYPPTAGALWWDEARVGSHNVTKYRALFTSVFGDQVLFSKLYGIELEDSATEIARGLERLGIGSVTGLVDSRFTHLELSSGQRMRLAMVVALLENRPICVFDEWTANQDPEMTHFYYKTLLPELMAQGRTIIAVSHDDRFFHMADHLIQLDEGGIIVNRSDGFG